MKLYITNTILFCSSILLSACGSEDSSIASTTDTYQQPDNIICDANSIVSNGLLCAIQPSRLDSASRDVYGNTTTGDSLLGFGYHVVAFPNTGTEIKGINIHLTGSYGRPYNQFSDKFGSSLFLNESLGAGYINIQLAYNNRFSINFDECGGDAANFNVDNCSGDVRKEKIIGEDVSIKTDTPVADSIEFRLLKLVEHLKSEGIVFPLEIVTNGVINWNLLRVSGHSQGATHALYLSKYFSANHACLLAGGYDVADTVPTVPPENIADWLLDNSVQIDISKVTALVSTDDDSYAAFIRAYNHLGLVKGVHYEEFSDAPYANESGTSITGHGATALDPRFNNLRVEACFSD